MGELTKEQRDKLVANFQTKTRGKCPMCGEKQWTTGPLLHVQVWSNGDVVLGGPVVPMASMICNTCKFVAQFAAIPLGLVSNPKQESLPFPPAAPKEGKDEQG